MAKTINPLLQKAIEETIGRNVVTEDEIVKIRAYNIELESEGLDQFPVPVATTLHQKEAMTAAVFEALAGMPDSSDVFAEENRTFAVEHGSRDDTFTRFQANSKDENYRDLAGVIVMHVLNSEQ